MTQRLSAARLERMHTVLGGYIDRGEMPGLVALVSRGETVHVEALGALSFGGSPMKRDAIFRIASMTKPITAAATMILVEECRLRLDDPVDEFLPEVASRKVLRRIAASDRRPARRRRACEPRDHVARCSHLPLGCSPSAQVGQN
jgi:CubicO group peptidase (beta-lactamase class C family)